MSVDPGQCPPLIRPAVNQRTSNSRSNLAACLSLSLGRPGEPFERTPTWPPSRHCRRHRSTDRSLNRNAAAIVGSSPRPRSVPRPAAGSAHARPSRRRSTRHPARTSQHQGSDRPAPDTSQVKARGLRNLGRAVCLSILQGCRCLYHPPPPSHHSQLLHAPCALHHHRGNPRPCPTW